MVAGHIVPVDAVAVEVVKEGETVFGSAVLEFFPVVGLRSLDAAKYIESTAVEMGNGCIFTKLFVSLRLDCALSHSKVVDLSRK